jgi:hypothetical protein
LPPGQGGIENNVKAAAGLLRLFYYNRPCLRTPSSAADLPVDEAASPLKSGPYKTIDANRAVQTCANVLFVLRESHLEGSLTEFLMFSDLRFQIEANFCCCNATLSHNIIWNRSNA